MRRLPHLALAAVLLALVAGCETPPDHDQQASIIQADVQQTFDGDMGALIYHGYEAARLAQAADAARGELASLPSYSPANINISNRANEMADQATEERRQAEAALNRLLDPLRLLVHHPGWRRVPFTNRPGRSQYRLRRTAKRHSGSLRPQNRRAAGNRP